MKKILNSHWQSGCLPVIIEDHGNSVEKYMHIFFSSLPQGRFSGRLHQVLSYLLSLTIYIFRFPHYFPDY